MTCLDNVTKSIMAFVKLVCFRSVSWTRTLFRHRRDQIEHFHVEWHFESKPFAGHKQPYRQERPGNIVTDLLGKIEYNGYLASSPAHFTNDRLENRTLDGIKVS